LADGLLSELDFDDSDGVAFGDSPEEAAAGLSPEPFAVVSLELESPEASLLLFERA
jgi:hypothetical protein